MAIYMWRDVYQGEYIKFKIKADSSGIIYVPYCGVSESGNYNCPYDWYISVNGGAETRYTGTGNTTVPCAIQLSGYTSGTEYTVNIRPASETYGWARAFSFQYSYARNYLTEVLYDCSYMGYAKSATDTGNYFRRTQYYQCTELIKAPEEYLPDTVTTIGTHFRNQQYRECTKIKYSPVEVLPNSVTSIGSGFRTQQYQLCSNLIDIKGWKDLNIGNSNYRSYQYYDATNNKTVKVLSDVGYEAYNGDALANSYVTQVKVPSAYLNNFKNSTKQPRVNITDSKFIGY